MSDRYRMLEGTPYDESVAIDTHGSKNPEQHEAISIGEIVKRLNAAEANEIAPPKLGRMIDINVAKIVRAFRAGDVVLIESESLISEAQIKSMREQLATTAALCDVEMIFLPPGCKVAAREEVESTSSIKP